MINGYVINSILIIPFKTCQYINSKYSTTQNIMLKYTEASRLLSETNYATILSHFFRYKCCLSLHKLSDCTLLCDRAISHERTSLYAMHVSSVIDLPYRSDHFSGSGQWIKRLPQKNAGGQPLTYGIIWVTIKILLSKSFVHTEMSQIVEIFRGGSQWSINPDNTVAV